MTELPKQTDRLPSEADQGGGKMRVTKQSGDLHVHAVAGTYVVSFGFHIPAAACQGLLGFSVHRTDHTDNVAGWINGSKVFQETDPGFPAGAQYSTQDHPVQSFQWADYTAKPGHRYTYRVLARKGTPRALVTAAEVSIAIVTESPANGDHDIHFNRGISASQEYARRFGDQRPSKEDDVDVESDPIYVWLSRGLYEALVAYIDACVPGRDALRIAAYEFAFAPLLKVIKRALDRGVDIRISYDGRAKKGGAPGKPNRDAVRAVGLDHVCTERTRPASVISHNKFIVKLTDGAPVSVWTGGTNFSRSGIFGHSNVAHVVEEPAIAAKFLDYWIALDADPDNATLTAAVEALSPLPSLPVPTGTTAIFSPRASEAALRAYADLAMSARQGLMMTFAFGINDVFKQVYQTSSAPFRLALLEKATRPMKDGPQKDAELAAIQALRNMPENVFAIGSLIATTAIDGWVKEQLSQLSANVQYVHNKFMLIDPLGADPIVIAGSANFSKASTLDNDENMVIVRGNKRVADIYLGEFMRLWNHHAFRESRSFANPGAAPRFLRIDDWWADSFGDTPRAARRRFFAGVTGD